MVTENQKPLCLLLKSPNVDFAESNEVLLWQNQAVCLIWNLKAKTRSSFPSGERTRQDESFRNVDQLNRVENVHHR